jgi:hypothetical protein
MYGILIVYKMLVKLIFLDETVCHFDKKILIMWIIHCILSQTVILFNFK